MNSELFVQNVKNACTIKGVAPTVACRESGAGTSFINNIESRGQIPSVAKVQQLATYLGVTTSQLLGETELDGTLILPSPIPPELSPPEETLLQNHRNLNPEGQEKLQEYADDLVCSGKYKKTSSN